MADADDGAADARLAAALDKVRAAPGPGGAARAEVLAALAGSRLFVAVRATATATAPAASGLRAESSAEMSVVTLVEGGRTALPVFSSTGSLRRWRPDARPVPLPGLQVCAAAVQQGAQLLLLDPADAAFAVGGRELAALAGGWVPVPGSALASRRTTDGLAEPAGAPDPELESALVEALAGEPVVAARLLGGPYGAVLGVVPRSPLGAAALAALAGRVAERLGERLPADGLDLAAVAADGPGRVLPLPGRPRRAAWRLRGISLRGITRGGLRRGR